MIFRILHHESSYWETQIVGTAVIFWFKNILIYVGLICNEVNDLW